jgi:hypothetical protein
MDLKNFLIFISPSFEHLEIRIGHKRAAIKKPGVTD